MNRLKSFFSLLLVLAVGCSLPVEPQPKAPVQIFAKDFLSSEKYTSLIVEIHYVTGFGFASTTITNLFDFLTQRLNKPNGINIKLNQLPLSGKEIYIQNDLYNVEALFRNQSITETTLTVFIFVAEKDYIGDGTNTKFIGVPFGPTSVAFFEKTLRDYAGGPGQPAIADLETTILLHQFCHLFGLVNIGTSMVTNHIDGLDGVHCSDANCLMNYKNDISDAASNLSNGIPVLSPACLEDLKANGGK